MDNPNEIWQVEVNGQVYDSTFSELTVWIAEDSLLESDKVRRGNLRWLEAGKVPPLVPFFNAKADGTPPPAVQKITVDAGEESGIPAADSVFNPTCEEEIEAHEDDRLAADGIAADAEPKPEINSSVCGIHPERISTYICKACFHGFCKECPQSFGSSVRLCPYCGAMCGSVKELQGVETSERRIQTDITEGFGFGDFGKALAYPFKYKTSLFFGALIVAVLGYGQSASAMGSPFLIGASIICFILSSALIFGMISNTLNNFAKGEINENFMPGIDDFSAWDDVIHPFLLFIGVWVSSFGLATVLMIGMVWHIVSTIKQEVANPETQLAMLAKDSAQSAKHRADLRKKFAEQNTVVADSDVGADGLTNAQRDTLDEEAEFQRINDIANNYKGQQLESTLGPTPEHRRQEMQALGAKLFQTAGVFIILIGIALLWGFLYFPAACAVAGYTRSFAAAINPLVGLDTIKHLGIDYFKIIVMSILISIMSLIVGIVFAVIFSPFDLPGLGNLPANFAASFVGFYFWVVFAVVIGFALYKNSDKLKLYR